MASKTKISIPDPAEKLKSVGKIKFSFEYYDLKRPEYCLSGWTNDQIKDSLARLKEINEKTHNELHQQRSVYHFHEVDWDKTKEKSGFPMILENPYQFALLGVNGQLARVFGSYVGGVFYIVWFDLTHCVSPSKMKNT